MHLAGATCVTLKWAALLFSLGGFLVEGYPGHTHDATPDSKTEFYRAHFCVRLRNPEESVGSAPRGYCHVCSGRNNDTEDRVSSITSLNLLMESSGYGHRRSPCVASGVLVPSKAPAAQHKKRRHTPTGDIANERQTRSYSISKYRRPCGSSPATLPLNPVGLILRRVNACCVKSVTLTSPTCRIGRANHRTAIALTAIAKIQHLPTNLTCPLYRSRS